MEINGHTIIGETELDGQVLGRAAALGDRRMDDIEDPEINETIRAFHGEETELVVIALARWACGSDYTSQRRGGLHRYQLRESLLIDSETASEYLCKIALGGLGRDASREEFLRRHYAPASLGSRTA